MSELARQETTVDATVVIRSLCSQLDWVAQQEEEQRLLVASLRRSVESLENARASAAAKLGLLQMSEPRHKHNLKLLDDITLGVAEWIEHLEKRPESARLTVGHVLAELRDLYERGTRP
jgi:hypothetical protein